MMDGDDADFIVDPETDKNAATFDDATGPIAIIKKTEKIRSAAMVYRRIICNSNNSWSWWSSIVDVDDRRSAGVVIVLEGIRVPHIVVVIGLQVSTRLGFGKVTICYDPYQKPTNRSKI